MCFVMQTWSQFCYWIWSSRYYGVKKISFLMMGKQFLSLLHNFGAIYIEIDESLFNFSNQWNLRKSFATRRKDQPLLNKNKNSQFLERFDDHLTWKYFGNILLQMVRHLGLWNAFMFAQNTNSDNMTMQQIVTGLV